MSQPEYLSSIRAQVERVARDERVPESIRLPALGVVAIACAFMVVGTIDYEVKVAAAREHKAAPRTNGKLLTESEARLWSKRCLQLDRQIFATQADGGRWKVQCVKAEVRS